MVHGREPVQELPLRCPHGGLLLEVVQTGALLRSLIL